MKNKKYLNSLRTSYHKIPIELYGMKLSVEAVGLYCYLACGKEDFHPSVRFTAQVLNVSTRKLKKMYEELLKRNMIKCYHKGFKNVTKKYEFIQVELWTKV